MYKEGKAMVRGHNIKVGDDILIERKTTKNTSPYDPRPYKATEVKGTQIKGERNGTTKTRDSQRWKKVEIGETRSFRKEEPDRDTDPDIGVPRETGRGAQPAGTTDGEAVLGAGTEAAGGAAGAGETTGEEERPRGRARGRRPREAWSRSLPRERAPGGTSYVWRYDLEGEQKRGRRFVRKKGGGK